MLKLNIYSLEKHFYTPIEYISPDVSFGWFPFCAVVFKSFIFPQCSTSKGGV